MLAGMTLALALTATTYVEEPCYESSYCPAATNHRCVACIEAGRSTCNLYPHAPYFPEVHGSYYFRPYNFSDIRKQQEIVKTLGGDTRYPYANDVFKTVYGR